MKSKNILISLTEEDHKILKTLAARLGLSVSALIRFLAREYKIKNPG